MSDIKFSLPGPDTITLSGQTVNKLLRSGDGDAILLYLYILKTEGKSGTEEIMATLGKGLGWINSAMATLSRIGLIHLEKNEDIANQISSEIANKPDDLSTATIGDIKRELEAGSDFSIVVEETQKSLGTILSPDDLMRLFGIYDELNMPPEVILQLITYCINESRRSKGRSPGIKYIEKAAHTWFRNGILTLERAEEYIKELEAKRSLRGEIRDALQIKNRELSATERKYVDKWIVLGFRADAIDLAYDRTVFKTGRMSWGYMDKILLSWNNQGLHTAKEIIGKDSKSLKSERVVAEYNRQKKVYTQNHDEINYMQRVLDKTKESQ